MAEEKRPLTSPQRTDNSAPSSSDSIEPVELLADDFMRRQRGGEQPTIEEYCEKHPDLADEIRDVFPALVVMEQVAPDDADLQVSGSPLESPDHRPIENVGDYRILREIGRGGMGVVYEAEQQSLGRRVALKVLPQHAAGDSKSLMRFQRERAAAKMHHTNIVPVFEVGQDKEYSYYAMQLIQGQGLDYVIRDLLDLRGQRTAVGKASGQVPRSADRSLAASLVQGHFQQENLIDSSGDSSGGSPDDKRAAAPGNMLTETLIQAASSTASASLPGQSDVSTAEDNRTAFFRSVAEIGLQCARALSYAHARGITHRDIKPSNLLLDTAGVVWITDFGLAHTTDSSMTQTGDILGTIRYMSPERFKGQCDNRADIYSLGLTLYELLSLKPAFESPDRLQLIELVTKKELTTPRSIDRRVPRDLETIVLKAADKDPKRRYQSADDLADDLQRFINHEPIHARRTSIPERMIRWSRRNPWLATALSVAAVALVAVAGVSAIAARQQSRLNADLEQTNEALQAKTEEQTKTNQQLVASNRTREELLDNLRRSQSRLSEKQAEYVAEKGDLAESMLWLARSYEHADEDDAATRRRLLARLTRTATKIPRLVREVPVQGQQPMLAFFQEIYSTASGQEGEAPIVTAAKASDELRGQFGGSPRLGGSSGTLVIPAWEERSDGDRSTILRLYGSRTGQWLGNPVRCEGAYSVHAFHEKKRWLATLSFVVTRLENEGGTPRFEPNDSEGPPRLQVEEVVVVRNVDSGEVVFQWRQDVPKTFLFLSGSGTRVGAINVIARKCSVMTLHFSDDGESLLRVRPRRPVHSGVHINHIALPGGQISEHEIQSLFVKDPNQSPSSRFRGPMSLRGAVVCRDHQRLFQSGRLLGGRSFAGRSRASSFVLCFDLEANKPIGQPIQYDDGNPLVLSEAGDRVAVIRAEAGRRWIQVHDVETGEQTGESIELDFSATSSLTLLNCSADGERLLVGSTRTRRNLPAAQTLGYGLVQVIDLASHSQPTPPMSISGRVQQAFFSADGSQLTVQDERQIRTWELRGSNLARTLFSFDSIDGVQGDGLLLAMDSDRLLTVDQTCTTWGGRTGSPQETKAIRAPSERPMRPRRISSNGKFLLLGVRPAGYERSTRYGVSLDVRPDIGFQRWDLTQGKPLGKVFSLDSSEVPLALGPTGSKLVVRVESSPGAAALRTVPNARPTYKLRIQDLASGTTIDVPPSRSTFPPVHASFSEDGRKLFVIAFPLLDVFSLTGDRITRVSQHRLTGFRRPAGGPFGFFGPFSSDNWAVSRDGRLVAGFSPDNHAIVVDVSSGNVIHSVDGVEVLPTAFGEPLAKLSLAPEGNAIYVATPGGLIWRSDLPSPWPDQPAEIYERLREGTGLEFGDDDTLQPATLASGTAWFSDQPSQAHPLEKSELKAIELLQKEAIQHERDEDWEAAAQALSEWSRRRPDDWIPLALRILPATRQGNMQEADDVWKRLVVLVGQPTASTWLQRLIAMKTQTGPGRGRSTFRDESAALAARWLQRRLLEAADDDRQRADCLCEIAKAEETLLHLDVAAETINQAAALAPDVAYLHHYRAHLMERLNRWEEATESRVAKVRLQPDAELGFFRLCSAHLFHGDDAGFRNVWHQYKERFARGTDASLTEESRLAKLWLTYGRPGPELELALEYADKAYSAVERGEKIGTSRNHYFIQDKGLCEYRRGNPEQALEYLKTASKLLEEKRSYYHREQGLVYFFCAMAYKEMGDDDAARDAYFEALDRQDYTRDMFLASNILVWGNWQLNEVARREAEKKLGISEDDIDSPVQATTSWDVVIEDNFDNGIRDNWQRLSGEWSVVDGTATATLREPDKSERFESTATLELAIPDLPSTFEIEFEVQTSAAMLTSCVLRGAADSPAFVGHRISLTSVPDQWLVNQGKPATGASLLTWAPFGQWFNASDPEFQFEPGKRYTVRILRQPQRITVFVGNKQVLSERVRNIETRYIRFFAGGDAGTKMSVDNFRVKTPPKTVDAERTRE